LKTGQTRESTGVGYHFAKKGHANSETYHLGEAKQRRQRESEKLKTTRSKRGLPKKHSVFIDAGTAQTGINKRCHKGKRHLQRGLSRRQEVCEMTRNCYAMNKTAKKIQKEIRQQGEMRKGRLDDNNRPAEGKSGTAD